MNCDRRRAMILSGNTVYKCGATFKNITTDNFDIYYHVSTNIMEKFIRTSKHTNIILVGIPYQVIRTVPKCIRKEIE